MPPPSIVATLGPASLLMGDRLLLAGATAFRLNASHLSATALEDAVRLVRGLLPKVPIVVDLQGAKMRLGDFPERYVCPGDTLHFARSPEAPSQIPLPHPELFAALRPGCTLSLDDQRVLLCVEHATGNDASCRVLSGTVVRPRKGVNLVDHPVELTELSPRDAEQLDAVKMIADVTFAFSFMSDGREAAWVRRRVPGARIVGKIERREAVANVERIACFCDEVWICRGDLGAQLGAAELARWVSGFNPSVFRVPVLMAGQVLEHLTRHPEPTRSEVCHLFDLIDRGYAGIVMSDETAIGNDPQGAVATARQLIDAFSSVQLKPGGIPSP